jgi:hypothetical protein
MEITRTKMERESWARPDRVRMHGGSVKIAGANKSN